MASMDLDTIIRDLNKRFAAPLPEFYKRRIIFWYDEDREFEDKLDDIQVDNAKLLVLTGTNNFAAKKLLNVDDTASNYLVYSPISYESQEDMVFVGNINQSVDVLLKTSSLFDPFPPEMGTDTAFLDRIHCYLPGWEIPKFRPEHFTND